MMHDDGPSDGDVERIHCILPVHALHTLHRPVFFVPIHSPLFHFSDVCTHTFPRQLPPSACDLDQVRATAQDVCADAVALVAQHQDRGGRTGNLVKRDGVVGQRGAHHLPPVLHALVQELHKVVSAVHLHHFHSTGRGLAHHGAEGGRVLRADDDLVAAQKIAGAQQGAEVLRVPHLVQSQYAAEGFSGLQVREAVEVERLGAQHKTLVGPVLGDHVEVVL
mmetsp:Transcript_14285/g.31506  ORF Transcript_14285/g.31506 Transcript_14285/m.31506 type:complete len:221 (+) Transcript_14285:84-746(+)